MVNVIQKIIAKAQANSIGAAALIVSVFGVLSRILGLIRDRILAAHYGAGDTLDMYYAAFRLPDLMFELLIVGALGAALIPVFSEIITKFKDRERAWRCANGILIILVVVFGIFAVFGIIFAPTLMHFIVPGFPEEKMMMTANLARIMFISPIFLSASAVLGGVLISYKKFVVFSMAPLFYNTGIIIGALFLVDFFGYLGLAAGVVLGAFLHFLVHLIATRSLNFKITTSFKILKNNKDVIKVLKLMIPRMFGSASNQISLLLITIFASALAAGSLTIFSFANNIQYAILGLIGIPFALAAFPALTEAYAKKKYSRFSKILYKTLKRILYYTVPLSIILFILREQVVRIAFGAGHFDLEDTLLTSAILGILCVSLFAQSITPLLARGFYATQNTKTPLYVALFSQSINIILILSLIRKFDIYAIAIAFSITAAINMSILFFLLAKKTADFNTFNIGSTVFKITIATIITGLGTYFTREFLGDILDLSYVWGVFVQLVIASIVGVSIYIFITALFKMEELETIKNKIIIKIFGRPQVASEEQNRGL